MTRKIQNIFFFVKWLIVIVAIKAILFIFFFNEFNKNYNADLIINKIFYVAAETNTYYGPIECLVNGFGYGSIKTDSIGDIHYMPSTRRVPGLLPLYAPLYKILGVEWAKTWMIIIQFLFSCLSVYCLALLAEKLFSSRKSFVICLLIYSVSTFVSIYDHIGLTESLSTSFLIFAFFFFFRAVEKTNQFLYILLAGIFSCWSIFLRPAHSMILPVLIIIFILFNYKKNAIIITRSLFFLMGVFIIPFIVVVTIWGIRNYNVRGKFIPLEDNVYEAQAHIYPPQYKAIQDLVAAWGGPIYPWAPNSECEWFMQPDASKKGNAIFAERHFTKEYTIDSLIQLRTYYQLSMSNNSRLPITASHKFYKEKTILLAERYKNAYKKERPFNYYFYSPLLLSGKFLFFRTANYLPFPKFSEMKLYQKSIKIFYILFYHIVLISAMIGMIVYIKQKNPLPIKLVALFPLLYTLILIFFLHRSEERYLVPLYPFFVLYSTYFMLYIANYKIQHNKTNSPMKYS